MNGYGTTRCSCPACRWRSLRGPLLLIAIGVLLLLHMLQPGWNGVVLVGLFLMYLGAYSVVGNLLPRAPASTLGQPGASPHWRSHWAGPIVLLVIGGTLVALHAFPGVPVAALASRYWPVLFIVWGVARLLEHFTAGSAGASGLSGGEVVLLILLIFCGLAFSGIYRMRQSPWVHYMGLHLEDWNPMFDSFPFTATRSAALAAGQRVEVRGYRGSVTLIPAPPGTQTVSAVVNDRVHALDQNQAGQLFGQAQPAVQSSGDLVVVTPAGDLRNGQVQADLQLTLPAATPVTVRLSSGAIEADHWRAPLQLTTSHSRVTIQDLTGDLDLSGTGDSVDLEHIQGNVNVHGSGGDVTLADISGTATLTGEYSGQLRFQNLAHGITFDSMRTNMTVGGLNGDMEGSLDNFRFHTSAVNVRMRTRNRGLSLDNFSGPLDIVDANSSIEAETSQPPTATISIATSNGDIELQLPPSSRFQLSATTHNGDIEDDFSVPVSQHGSTETAQGAVNGGGPQVTLTTRNGNIRLHN